MAVMLLKKSVFCGLECRFVPFSLGVLRNPKLYHSHGSLSLDQVFLTGYIQVKTDTSGSQLCASLSNPKMHIEDIGKIFHIYFSSACKMIRPNEQQKHYPMSIYYPKQYKSRPVLFCVRNKYSKHSRWDALKNIFLCNVADATDQTI